LRLFGHLSRLVQTGRLHFSRDPRTRFWHQAAVEKWKEYRGVICANAAFAKVASRAEITGAVGLIHGGGPKRLLCDSQRHQGARLARFDRLSPARQMLVKR
jgi:hypothetical protein